MMPHPSLRTRLAFAWHALRGDSIVMNIEMVLSPRGLRVPDTQGLFAEMKPTGGTPAPDALPTVVNQVSAPSRSSGCRNTGYYHPT